MVFSHNDAPKVYDGTPVHELKRGLYYVTTDNHIVLRGDSIYTRRLLQFAAEDGVDFTIRSMAVASRSAPKDLFRTLMQEIVVHTHTKDLPAGVSVNDMRRARKRVRVSAFGMLMKTMRVDFSRAATVSAAHKEEIWSLAARSDVWSGTEWKTLVNMELDGGGTRLYAMKSQKVKLEHKRRRSLSGPGREPLAPAGDVPAFRGAATVLPHRRRGPSQPHHKGCLSGARGCD